MGRASSRQLTNDKKMSVSCKIVIDVETPWISNSHNSNNNFPVDEIRTAKARLSVSKVEVWFENPNYQAIMYFKKT